MSVTDFSELAEMKPDFILPEAYISQGVALGPPLWGLGCEHHLSPGFRDVRCGSRRFTLGTSIKRRGRGDAEAAETQRTKPRKGWSHISPGWSDVSLTNVAQPWVRSSIKAISPNRGGPNKVRQRPNGQSQTYRSSISIRYLLQISRNSSK